jgi:hypothetical protein
MADDFCSGTGWIIQIVANHKMGNEAEAARWFLNLVELN